VDSGRWRLDIEYGGRVVAYALSDHVLLLRPVAVLELDHPVRRFVSLLALVAREMHTDDLAEPYTAARARLYTRMLLMPEEDFTPAAARQADVQLAERFNVPLDEVRARHADLGTRSPARSSTRAQRSP
jgi:hypothetical protein